MDKAYKLLLDQEQKKRIIDVIHAGKEYVEHMVCDNVVLCQSFFCLTFLGVCETFSSSVTSYKGKGEKETVKERWEATGCGGG